jgi:hypothetical protein
MQVNKISLVGVVSLTLFKSRHKTHGGMDVHGQKGILQMH